MNFIKKLVGTKKGSDCCGVEIIEVETSEESCCSSEAETESGSCCEDEKDAGSCCA
ncbi:hypothetical protein ACFFJY_16405 [Fictibacillus aquaticus]|uniref:hypothetical protein n=1 Tax=Fictibacillus aquaticus TaxID=2021314 RepID=UPI0013FD4F54|nr:hypothetical protein [Fictibacillus aquaticus]